MKDELSTKIIFTCIIIAVWAFTCGIARLLKYRKAKQINSNIRLKITLSSSKNASFYLSGIVNKRHVLLDINDYTDIKSYILDNRLCVGDIIVVSTQGYPDESFKILSINSCIKNNDKIKLYEIRINEIGAEKIPAYKPITSKLAECYDGDVDASYMMYQYDNSFWYEKE